jgi:alpha-tubulin suppressor-like RCC1 family protein
LTPVLVSGGLSFAAVSAGFEFDLREHTCGVTTGGVAYCWGSNAFGQLGDGTSLNIKIVPVLVLGGHTFASVRAAGADHTCGVTTGGVAYCWGWNSQGVLGDGTATNRTTPVAVAGGLSFAAVSASVFHTAYCWGANAQGWLGDGTTTGRLTPVLVSGGLSFAAVSAGNGHTCGVTTGGVAYCWGSNAFGKLGDGADSRSTTPVAVAGGLSFASVSAGGNHTCGVTTGGDAYCWGWNNTGQLGNGTTTNSSVPVGVSGQP